MAGESLRASSSCGRAPTTPIEMGEAPRVFLSLGSNIEPDANLRAAVQRLREAVEVRGVSRTYRTEPVGGARGPRFLNAAVEIATPLAPAALKRDVLRRIESELGRVRVEDKSAPRTIDLDLLLFDGNTVDSSELKVPHPRMHERAFVLAPLVELEPGIDIPGRGAAADLLRACAGQPIERLPA